ncbi:MAG: GTP-binding protein, partial [Eubacteriales bacterium]|nr:GTP-binding protein [Eubacteriales bacterium]
MKLRDDIRNIAIIAHVDHGKTTLVDGLLRQSGVFRDNQQVAERVMDSNDLERERGITILSKNTSVFYNGTTINIVDTPGHADFGGEVERVLNMVDGVLLLVDAYDGPMPQTRFVLSKALKLDLKPIVVINKIDRQDARPVEVVDQILELFMELGASSEQLDFPIIYASAREGYAMEEPDEEGSDLMPLLDAILEHIPAPEVDFDMPLQLLISSMEYDDFVGKIAIGRIERGIITAGQQALLCKYGIDDERQIKVTGLFQFAGIGRKSTTSVKAGDIVALTGAGDFHIGDTICDLENPEPLPFVKIDEPTVSMTFSVNDSPFAGNEGTFVTSRHLRDRLFKELLSNVSLNVKETGTADSFEVSGRGELHLSILIETMRRQGYEFQVSKPRVIMKEIDGVLHEPIEQL